RIGAGRLIKIEADGTDKVFVLNKEASRRAWVHIKASDSRTSRPVKIRSVSAERNGEMVYKHLIEPLTNECNVEIRQDQFKVGMAPQYKLKVEAENYAPFVTEYIDLAEGDQNLEVSLNPASNAKGMLLLTDGGPAAKATVWSTRPEMGETL